MTDPFYAAKPYAPVHEIIGRDFDLAWLRAEAAEAVLCPRCRQGVAVERGFSWFQERRWISFSCGEIVAAQAL